jgi:hypothetical protein
VTVTGTTGTTGAAGAIGWADPTFLDQAEAWIRAQVPVRGRIDQVHVQWWSTVLRIPTADGPLWFKAVAPEATFEVSLTAFLADRRPDLLPALVAADPAVGWMILSHGGVRLRDANETVEDWEAILPRYAELQIGLAADVERLVAMGVPVEDLGSLPDRVEHLLAGEEFLMLDQPDGLSSADRGRLQGLASAIRALCVELASFGIPETIQHDDLHGGAVLVKDGQHRIFDWGDTCLSHPFHSLTVLLRATAWKLGLEPGGPELLRMRDAYLEPFTALGSRADVLAAAAIAYRTGTLGRALAWRRYLAARPPDAWDDDLEAIPYGLARFLENGPIGTWAG